MSPLPEKNVSKEFGKEHANLNKPQYPEDPQAKLERMHIDAYLAGKGLCWKDLCTLAEHEARQLMIEACRYASARLAEVETRSRLLHSIQGEE